jgi:hypothetical protein
MKARRITQQFSRTAIEDVEQQGCSSAGSTTRVNKMLAPFFG